MFKHQIRVAYRDVTLGNHVYYARYLDFIEIARNEMFRGLGHSLLALQERGTIFPVVECSLHHHRAARYDDLLEIETNLTALGRVQFSLKYRVGRDQTLLLEAMTRHAVTDLSEKPVAMPGDLRAALLPHLEKSATHS